MPGVFAQLHIFFVTLLLLLNHKPLLRIIPPIHTLVPHPKTSKQPRPRNPRHDVPDHSQRIRIYKPVRNLHNLGKRFNRSISTRSLRTCHNKLFWHLPIRNSFVKKLIELILKHGPTDRNSECLSDATEEGDSRGGDAEVFVDGGGLNGEYGELEEESAADGRDDAEGVENSAVGIGLHEGVEAGPACDEDPCYPGHFLEAEGAGYPDAAEDGGECYRGSVVSRLVYLFMTGEWVHLPARKCFR